MGNSKPTDCMSIFAYSWAYGYIILCLERFLKLPVVYYVDIGLLGFLLLHGRRKIMQLASPLLYLFDLKIFGLIKVFIDAYETINYKILLQIKLHLHYL